ncbi:kinase-like domain-containing protein [Hypoxylon rubiginosum]|uniref:Kinase-like domain-containing protein n=1 Tax=Hypoxylon rubiginosum TaxID=110542 RepID=A0ACC0CZX2_9PEZI|nr:kinase-like domain-containing protein [Hypoxylon rubiginosum]
MLPKTTILPYFRSVEELPAPLPTSAAIEAGTKFLPSIYTPSQRLTVIVGDHFVVKYGTRMSENEGHALLYLEKYQSIPVPRLYAMYRDNGKLYLIMEFKPGRQLRELWPSLSSDDILDISRQLRKIWDQLRSIPSPSIFGNVTGGPLQHRYFQWIDPDPRITGPFDKEEDVNNALVLRTKKNWEGVGQRGWLPDFFARHLPKVLTGHSNVFTHADLQRKNILVLEVPASRGRPRRFEVSAVVDWEDAGWYPSYWEYASCFIHFQWIDSWPENVEWILDPYISEAAILRLVREDLDF